MTTNTQNRRNALRGIFQTAMNDYHSQAKPSNISAAYYSNTIAEETSEDYAFGDVPGGKAWNSDRRFQRLAKYKFNITSTPWTGGEFKFDRLMNVAQNANLIRGHMQKSIAVVDRIPDQQVIKTLQNAENLTAFDGQKFFLAAAAGQRRYANMINKTGVTEANIKTDLDRLNDILDGFETNTGNELELDAVTILAPTSIYNVFRTITESRASTEDNKNANVVNLYDKWNVIRVPKLNNTTKSWYALINTPTAYPIIWQTTTIEGDRIRLDIVDYTEGINSSIGVGASIYGAAAVAYPWAAIKVK